MVFKLWKWLMGLHLQSGCWTEQNIGAWVGHAGQDNALRPLFGGNARPLDFVANATAVQLANTGAAGTISA
jgi:hypothetical protein